MQYCGKCGNYNSTESIFCGHCANRLNHNCPDCGFGNLPGQKFCGNCGKQLLSDQELNFPPDSPLPPPGMTVAPPTHVSPIGNIDNIEWMPPAEKNVVPESRWSADTSPASVAAAAHPPDVYQASTPLQAYALASVELYDWAQWTARIGDKIRVAAWQKQFDAYLQERIFAAGGVISAHKKNILFISFKHEESPEASLAQAIAFCLDLLSEEFRFQDQVIQLRIGLDIEYAYARNPLTSTLERSVGAAGTLTVSEGVYQAAQDAYPMEPIGPVNLGRRTLTFYRLYPVGTVLKAPSRPLGSSVAVPTTPRPITPPSPVVSVAPPLPPDLTTEPPALADVASSQPSVTPPLEAATTIDPLQAAWEEPVEDWDAPRPETLLDLDESRRKAFDAEAFDTEKLNAEFAELNEEEPPVLTLSPGETEPVTNWAEDATQAGALQAWEGDHPTAAILPSASAPDDVEPLATEGPAWEDPDAPLEAVEQPLTDEPVEAIPLPPPGPAAWEASAETEAALAERLEAIQAEADAAPEPPPTPVETLEEPALLAPPSAVEEAPAHLFSDDPAMAAEEVPLPVYEPPVYGMRQGVRPSNVNYEGAIDALGAELESFLARGVKNNPGKVVSVCGADGLGKSSIVHMARAKVDPENQLGIWMGAHHYRSFYQQRLPLYYWVELVQNLLNLVFEGQPATQVKEQIDQFLGYVHEGNPVPADERAFLEDFLSAQPLQPLDEADKDHLDRLETFFLRFLQFLATKRPLIIVMEDLMFAEAASVDLLTRLLERRLLQAPVYFIFTHARDFHPAGRFGEALQKAPRKELVISDLTRTEAENFLDNGPLGGRLDEFPTDMIDGLVQSAKGLPLYLEEALRLLMQKKILAIDPESGKFLLRRKFDASEAAFPESVKALVRLRVEFLSEQALYVLRLASVLGEKFAVSLLMVLSQLEEEAFNEIVGGLFNDGYFLPDVVNSVRFRHGLIWEAVYEDIEDDLRVQMHQLVSETLDHDFGHGITVNPVLVAYHAENGALYNRALNYWNLAGIFAGQAGSLVGMNMAMYRALDLLKASVSAPLYTQELALRMLETLGSFNLEENPELAVGMLEWVFHYRRLEGQAAKLIEPLSLLAAAYEQKGDFPKALVTLEKSLEFVDARVYPVESVTLQINKLEYLYILGRLQQARTLMESVIEPVAERQGYERGSEAFFEAYLQARLLKAQILLAQCDPQAEEILSDARSHAEEKGLNGLSIALQLAQGQLNLRHGDYEACNRQADHLLSAIEAMDGADWFLAQWGMLAILYHCELEDWSSASQLVLTVVAKSEAVRDYQTWVVAQAYAGHIAGKLGKLKDARQLLEQAIELSARHHFASAALLSWRFLAELEADQGNREVAYQVASKALAIAIKPDIRNGYESVQLTLLCARTLMAEGQPKPAGRLLEPIWPQVVKSRSNPLIAACAFEIGQLYKQLAQDVPADLSRKHLGQSVEFFTKARDLWQTLGQRAKAQAVDAVIPRL